MQYVSAMVVVAGLATAANAQVTITEVDRHVAANACVFAPSNYPNWCEHDGGSNATVGPWTKGATFGNSAAGDVGYGSSITVASQQSAAGSDLIWVTGGARVEVDSEGNCGANGTASSYFSVSFKLHSPARAVLTGYTTFSSGGAEFLLSLQQLDGAFGYIQSDSYDAEFDLEVGEYRYLVSVSAAGSCSGPCSHHELLSWNSQLTFKPLACPSDFNGDGFVEDSDFVMFVTAYNELLCPEPPGACPCDLNKDGLVEDADFVFFVSAYNELVCP